MTPSGMWRRVGLVGTDASEERVASMLYPEDGGDTTRRRHCCVLNDISGTDIWVTAVCTGNEL
jgi:hypothetical protein